MPIYFTDYSEGLATYGGYIEADTYEHALQLAIRRGLNERVLGETEGASMPNRLRQLILEQNWLDAAHEACFLGFTGMMSGMLSPRDVVGDSGLVHELIHLARHKPTRLDEDPDIIAEDRAEHAALIEKVKALAAALEWRVPGWVTTGGQPGVHYTHHDVEPEDESKEWLAAITERYKHLLKNIFKQFTRK